MFFISQTSDSILAIQKLKMNIYIYSISIKNSIMVEEKQENKGFWTIFNNLEIVPFNMPNPNKIKMIRDLK